MRWTILGLAVLAGAAHAVTLAPGSEVYVAFVLKDYCHAHFPEQRQKLDAALGDWHVRNRPAIERVQNQNDFARELEAVKKAFEVDTARADYAETCQKFPELLLTPEFNRKDFLRP